jgi:hypothetical protein
VAEEAAEAADADADATGTDLTRLGKVVATLQRQLEATQLESRAALEGKARAEAMVTTLADQNGALEVALRERAAAAQEAAGACAEARAAAADAAARIDATSRGREEKDALLREFMAATRVLEAEKGALLSGTERMHQELEDVKAALQAAQAQAQAAAQDAAAARQEALEAAAAAEAALSAQHEARALALEQRALAQAASAAADNAMAERNAAVATAEAVTSAAQRAAQEQAQGAVQELSSLRAHFAAELERVTRDAAADKAAVVESWEVAYAGLSEEKDAAMRVAEEQWGQRMEGVLDASRAALAACRAEADAALAEREAQLTAAAAAAEQRLRQELTARMEDALAAERGVSAAAAASAAQQNQQAMMQVAALTVARDASVAALDDVRAEMAGVRDQARRDLAAAAEAAASERADAHREAREVGYAHERAMGAATQAVAALQQRVRDVEARERALMAKCNEALTAAATAQRAAAAQEARASGAAYAAQAAQDGFEAELRAKNEELQALHGAVRDLRDWHAKFFAAVASDISHMQQEKGKEVGARLASPIAARHGGSLHMHVADLL